MTRHQSWAAMTVLAVAACSRAGRSVPNDTTTGATQGMSAAAAPGRQADSLQAPATRSDTGSSSTAPTPTSTPTVTPSETVLTGKVVASGLANAPVTQLQIEGAKPATLIGPLEPELRRLGGAVVWVAGAGGPTATRPNVTFTVSRYEIVSIDGAKPFVGIVRPGTPDALLAMDRDTVRLTVAPADLTSKAGAKVWVTGRLVGKALTVQAFGIIREP